MEIERMLRLPDVCKIVGIKRDGIYKLIRQNRFPQSVKIGMRIVAWPESAIQKWIADRIAESSKAAA